MVEDRKLLKVGDEFIREEREAAAKEGFSTREERGRA